MSNREPQLTDEDDARLTRVWDGFHAAGGDRLSPELSLSPLTLGASDATLPPGIDHYVGPGELEPGALLPLDLTADGEFSPRDLLGRGGMGEVHVALDRSLRREVAVKTVGPDPTPQKRQALLQEALFTGYVEHPNVVPVHRLGTDPDGRPAFVMKRVSGTSWRELLRDPQHPGWAALPADRLRANLEILGQVCHALHYAHSRGVIHRDVKPENVMVGRFGEVYLLDWGLALRLDQAALVGDVVVGTLAYMAPEMLGESEQLSPATDVYLLGATLHEALTGEARHRGSAHFNVMLKVLTSAPVAYGEDVPRELAELCNQATARDPAARPESAQAFRERLERFLEHRGSITLTDEARGRLETLTASYAAGEDGPAAATLFSECRFGFQQALAIWPENEAAREGLQACLALTIERDLAAGRLGRAASLLAELPAPRADLAERLAAAEVEAARAPARLKELEEDVDLTLGARQRALIVALMALGSCVPVGALPFLLAPRGPLPLSYGTFAGIGLGIGIWFTILLLYGKQGLLRNTANRRLGEQIAAGWLACMFVLVSFWAYGVKLGMMFWVVGLVMTAVAMQLAVVSDRRIWLLMPFACGSGFLNLWFPSLDPLFMQAVVGGGSLVFVTAIWWRDSQAGGQST